MGKQKPLAVGIEFYKEIIDRPYYYVDKTLLIKELLDRGGKVNLFTRPRRFGKTLALSMIRTFFEVDMDAEGNVTDNRHYFDGMKIMLEGNEYTDKMGQYPVISLSLKSAKQPDFQMSYQSIMDEISKEYERHMYVLQGEALLPANKEKYSRIMSRKAERIDCARSLAFLAECLRKYHRKNTIILIDEYDVPLENAYFQGFYDEMIQFIRSLFESALKTNDNLEFAVVTGCLRISKESIFTGLNNLEVISIRNIAFAEYFGFTESEVEQLFADYDMGHKLSEAKAWYDGYLFGKTEIYNPWSILKYVKAALSDMEAFPEPYWSNTSSNSIVKELVENAEENVKKELESLIAGGTIEKPVHEDITYGDIHSSQDNLWNFLLFTGYLKMVGERFEQNTIYLTMKIPNEEIRYIYCNMVREWFQRKIKATDFRAFYRALLEGDSVTLEKLMTEQLRGSISFYDNAESFYHGYLLGIVMGVADYKVTSNREAGNGRPDICLSPPTLGEPAIVIEVKTVKSLKEMEQQCDAALAQIEERDYTAELIREGYQHILKYGICFCGKACRVMVKQK